MNPSRWARQKPPRRLVSYWPVGVPGFEVIAFQKWGFPKPWGILSPLDESMVYCQDVGKLHFFDSTWFLHRNWTHLHFFRWSCLRYVPPQRSGGTCLVRLGGDQMQTLMLGAGDCLCYFECWNSCIHNLTFTMLHTFAYLLLIYQLSIDFLKGH